MTRLTVLLLAVLISGCSNTSAAIKASDDHALTADQSRQLIAAFEARQTAVQTNDPLARGTTLDDAVEILKRDEFALFPTGAEIAEKDGSPKGRIVQAQIELAWGEAQHIVSDLLARATRNLRDEKVELLRKQSAKPLDEAETASLQSLEKTLDEVAGLSTALTTLGDEHISKGIAVAEVAIQQAPDDYAGYRVAADFYRLREDWAKFDETIAKLEKLNPDSNGLVFARAMDALTRQGERGKAIELLNKALVTDPKFTRARAQLVLAHTELDPAWKEFQALKESTPNHQIVTWLGPTLEAEHKSLENRARRARGVQWRMLDRIQSKEPKQ